GQLRRRLGGEHRPATPGVVLTRWQPNTLVTAAASAEPSSDLRHRGPTLIGHGPRVPPPQPDIPAERAELTPLALASQDATPLFTIGSEGDSMRRPSASLAAVVMATVVSIVRPMAADAATQDVPCSPSAL